MRATSTYRETGCAPLDDFISKLRSKMESRGLSVRDLAREAGVGYPYLYRVLKGEQNPSIDWMEKVGAEVGLKIKISVR